MLIKADGRALLASRDAVLKTSARDAMTPTRQGGRRRTGFKYSDSRFTQQNFISGLNVVFISPPPL